MRKFKTARLHYSFEDKHFYILPSIDILAHDLDEAIIYCELNYPELVICGERERYVEELLVGKYKFKFNYN